MPHLISKACTKCSACLTECPTGSIIEGSTQYYIDADSCMDHLACVAVCPVNAITLRPTVGVAPPGKTGSKPDAKPNAKTVKK